MHRSSAAYELHTRGYSLYKWNKCAGLEWEGGHLHYLRRKPPSVRVLRELSSWEFKRSAYHWPEGSAEPGLLVGNFLTHGHSFLSHVSPVWSTRKLGTTHMHKYKHVRPNTLLLFNIFWWDVWTSLGTWPDWVSLSFLFLQNRNDLNWWQWISGLSKQPLQCDKGVERAMGLAFKKRAFLNDMSLKRRGATRSAKAGKSSEFSKFQHITAGITPIIYIMSCDRDSWGVRGGCL